jgi:hypothetical protein
MRRDRAWLAVLLIPAALLAGTPAVAADLGYQVEAIVFERNTPDSVEGPPAGAPVLPDPALAVDLAAADSHIEPLPADALQLAGVAARLKKSGRFTPLMHTGWRQGGDETRSVHLRSEAVTADGLPLVDGTLHLRVSRQLSAVVDLAYQYNGQAMHITGNRIVKFGELHYFDHPLFGLLLQVTRTRAAE